MKKLFLRAVLLSALMLMVIFIAGCSGGQNDKEQVGLVLPEANYKFFKNSDLQIQYPVNWKVLNKQQISSKYKENFEVGFTSNFKDPFFTPTITVEKIKIDEDLNSESFSELVINQNKEKLVNYLELEKSTVSTLVANEPVITTLIRFSGKEKIQDDLIEYVQTYLVKNELGYIVTAAFDPTDENNEFEKMVNSLRTFKLL